MNRRNYVQNFKDRNSMLAKCWKLVEITFWLIWSANMNINITRIVFSLYSTERTIRANIMSSQQLLNRCICSYVTILGAETGFRLNKNYHKDHQKSIEA